MNSNTPNQANTAKKTTLKVLIILILASAVAFFYWLSQGSATTHAQADKPNDANATAAQPQPAAHSTQQHTPQTNTPAQPPKATPKFVTGTENLPRSLEGTEVDGEIIINENKQLVVTNGLRRLFDYFLTTQGEEDLATIIARVEAYINSRVPEPARSQAISLFHKYLDYLKATANISEAGGKPASQIDINAVIAQKKQLADLQKQYFTADTIKAFFGIENIYDDYNIKLFQIAENDSLTPDQKEAARQQALEDIPDVQMKTQIKQQQNFSKLMEETKKLKKAGASKEQLRQMRTKLVGAEAAARLEQLDEKRAVWEERVSSYLSQRQQILGSKENQTSKDLKVNELRHRMFTENEQKRLAAYEELGKAQLD